MLRHRYIKEYSHKDKRSESPTRWFNMKVGDKVGTGPGASTFLGICPECNSSVLERDGHATCGCPCCEAKVLRYFSRESPGRVVARFSYKSLTPKEMVAIENKTHRIRLTMDNVNEEFLVVMEG